MSQGSPIVPVRFPVDLLSQVDGEIDKSKNTRADTPFNRSSFILTAVRQKLDHMRRSRKKKGKRGDS